MLGTAILEKRRFVFVATKWTHSSNYRGSFLAYSPQRRAYVYRDNVVLRTDIRLWQTHIVTTTILYWFLHILMNYLRNWG